MPIPTLITDLSTTASLNSPAGGDNLSTADDYLRAVQGIVKTVYDAQVVTNGLKVDKTSSTGSAVIPSGTTAQRDVTPSAGYTRFNSTTGSAEIYDGSAWGSVGGGATGGTGNAAFYLNDQTITADFTIPVGQNAGSFGSMTIASGVSVTISTGSSWSIV